MQNEGQEDNLYIIIKDFIPKSVLTNKNKGKSWEYGYNLKYNFVVISKDGTLGDVVSISGLVIGLPATPKSCWSRSKKKQEQYWERQELPKELSKIKSIFQWNDLPSDFKDRHVDYIEQEFDYRESGMFFKNNGISSYVTGSHYMYCLLYTSPSPRD